MVVNVFQYLLMISPENVSLDETELKKLNNFKYEFWLYFSTYIFHKTLTL